MALIICIAGGFFGLLVGLIALISGAGVMTALLLWAATGFAIASALALFAVWPRRLARELRT